MTQALYRKWRPARFDAVIGQEHVTRTLRNAIASGRSGHAYLFCGPRGTGKTTTARLLAKAVNCQHEDLAERPCNNCPSCRAIAEGRFLDLIEIDAASNTGVDDIRDLRDKINFSPSEGRFKVYIIDEVHMLSTAAFNALLKTLEEPPPHAKFVLATTEEHKVPLTIKSRCQQFNFRLLTQAEIASRLRWIAQQEQLSVEPEALELIARQGSGSIRDAESLLDQLVAAPGDIISLERTQMVLGTASNQAVADLVDAWLSSDAPGGLRIIHSALSAGADVRQFARQMVDYLRNVLLLQAAGDDVPLNVSEEERQRMASQCRQASREGLIEAVKAFNGAALASSSSWQPQLPLELGFISLLPDEPASQPPPAAPTVQKPTPAADKTDAEPPQPEASEPQTTAEPGTTPLATDPSDAGEASEPEAETTSQEQPLPASAKPSSITLQAVKQHWEPMVVRVGQEDRNLPALLNVSKPLAIEGNAIVLGFDYGVLKEKFEDRPGARELVAATLSDLLGAKCIVRCVVSDRYTPPEPAPEQELEEEPESQADATQPTSSPPSETETTVDRDAFYALADELGGEVRES